MDRIKSIQIPQPCGQSWQQMTVNNDGRHCTHCCKTVVDFTRMTNSEIIAYISGKEHVCGRFDAYQINSVNQYLSAKNEKRFSWKGLVAGFTFLSLIPAQRSEAKIKPAIEQTDRAFQRPNYLVENDSLKEVVIVGTVIAKDDNLPIPGAVIKLKNCRTLATTDTNGKFTLRVKDLKGTLVITSIGYTPQEIRIKSIKSTSQIKLQPAFSGMLEIIPFSKRTLFQRIKGVLGAYTILKADDKTQSSPYY